MAGLGGAAGAHTATRWLVLAEQREHHRDRWLRWLVLAEQREHHRDRWLRWLVLAEQREHHARSIGAGVTATVPFGAKPTLEANSGDALAPLVKGQVLAPRNAPSRAVTCA